MASSLSCDAFMLLCLLIYLFIYLIFFLVACVTSTLTRTGPSSKFSNFLLVGVWRTFGLAASLVKLSVWQCCGGALTAVHG